MIPASCFVVNSSVFLAIRNNLIQYDFVVVALKRKLSVRRVSLPKSVCRFVNYGTNNLKEGLQSNLDYPDSLGPHEIVRIYNRGSGYIIENMNINEEQNRAKLIKLRKRHLIVKQQFYKSFGIQYRLHLHFYLLWKEQIAWRLWINVRDACLFVFHDIEP